MSILSHTQLPPEGYFSIPPPCSPTLMPGYGGTAAGPSLPLSLPPAAPPQSQTFVPSLSEASPSPAPALTPLAHVPLQQQQQHELIRRGVGIGGIPIVEIDEIEEVDESEDDDALEQREEEQVELGTHHSHHSHRHQLHDAAVKVEIKEEEEEVPQDGENLMELQEVNSPCSTCGYHSDASLETLKRSMLERFSSKERREQRPLLAQTQLLRAQAAAVASSDRRGGGG